MKRTMYSLMILLAGLVGAQKKVDVKASYGTASLYGTATSLTGDIASIIVTGAKELSDYDSNGVFALEVMLHSNNSKWTYGLGYNRETVKDNAQSFKADFNTILAQSHYYWTNASSKLRIYSGIGAGALISSSANNSVTDNEVLFAFNVLPVGIHYGEKLGVFLETNVGTKGFLQGGVSYTF